MTVALFKKGSELDDWAKALGVTNDDDAAAAVRSLLIKLEEALANAREVARALGEAPMPSATTAAASAVREISAAADTLAQVVNRFKRHERGRG